MRIRYGIMLCVGLVATSALVRSKAVEASVMIPQAEYDQLKREASRVKELEFELERLKQSMNSGTVAKTNEISDGIAPAKGVTNRNSELKAAQAEVERLKTEKRAALASQNRALSTAESKAMEKLPPPRDILTLKPLGEGDTVSVQELIAHYAEDTKTADQHYKQKVFHLQGVVTDADKTLLRSSFKLFFKVPGQPLLAVCEVYPPDKYTKVYVAGDRTKVLGEMAGRYPTTLATVGEELTFVVRCLGVKDGRVMLDSVTLGR